jgi:hypothetical protein
LCRLSKQEKRYATGETRSIGVFGFRAAKPLKLCSVINVKL